MVTLRTVEKTLLTGEKTKMEETSQELQTRDPSPRTDRHAVDVACTTEQNHSLQSR